MRKQKPSEISIFFAFDEKYIKLTVILPGQMLILSSDWQFCMLLMNTNGKT